MISTVVTTSVSVHRVTDRVLVAFLSGQAYGSQRSGSLPCFRGGVMHAPRDKRGSRGLAESGKRGHVGLVAPDSGSGTDGHRGQDSAPPLVCPWRPLVFGDFHRAQCQKRCFCGPVLRARAFFFIISFLFPFFGLRWVFSRTDAPHHVREHPAELGTRLYGLPSRVFYPSVVLSSSFIRPS